MPEMSEENYNALLERLKKQDETIASLNKRIEDVCAMNTALLNTSDSGLPSTPPSERRKELAEKLKGGLRHA